MAKISIIVPVYFNAVNLPDTIPALQQILASLPNFEGEMIFVDDGSKDASFSLLKQFAGEDARIKVVRLTRNFGAHTALLAGLDHATGDCVTFIMADLQDPPELILEMTKAWLAGSKIVVAERTEREDDLMDRLFASFFWWFMRRFAIKDMPKGGFDFVLFDRVVADIITRTREKNSHLMAQIFWTGFDPKIISYTRRRREKGSSKWSTSKKIKLFIDSSIAFSYLPIRAMSLLGLGTAISGFLLGIYILIQKLTSDSIVQGWTSLMVVVLFLGGIQMLLLGIIGEYLWRTFDQTRNRPDYNVSEKINL